VQSFDVILVCLNRAIKTVDSCGKQPLTSKHIASLAPDERPWCKKKYHLIEYFCSCIISSLRSVARKTQRE
jgi:hypothetical protein